MSNKNTTAKPKSKAVIALLAIACAAFLTVVFVGGYVLFNVLSSTHDEVVINLEEYKKNQNQTSFVYAYDEDGKTVELASLHGEENRVWVELDDISPNLLDAFVAIEDIRFYKHSGVDWKRTIGVVVKFGFSQGGSTITQQLIKNITNEKDVTFVRKFNEIISALNLENYYDKPTILEAYLNTLYLGSGCYGVKTASETYFGKDVSELNLAEAATIACITKAPYTYNPLVNPEKSKERQEYCLEIMLEEGMISQQEYDEAINYELILTNSDKYVPDEEEEVKEKEEEETKIWGYYVDYVIECVIDDLMEQYGYTRSQASDKIYYGGLRIYAAVDLDIQEDLEYVFENRKGFANDEIQGAMTVMDYSGRIVGIVGGAGEIERNRDWNRASDTFRQPGSTIKPLSTYAPLLDLNKITWSSHTLDYAFAYRGEMWPHNVDKTYGSGNNVTTQKAVQESMNTVPARLINNTLTPAMSLKYLKDHFMLSQIDDENDINLGPLATGSLTNGANTVEMAAAYATFGNGGKYYEPYSYYKVTNSQGTEVLLDNTQKIGIQVISEEASDIMCEILQTVKTSYYGTASNVRRFQIMAKTGTTTDDKDRWFCAGTPYYVGAVWYGYDKPKSINASINPAGTIFFNVFDRIHKGLDDDIKFPKSGKTVQKKYCTATGNLAGTYCPSSTGWFSLTNLPKTCTHCKSRPSGENSEVSSLIDEAVGDINNIINEFLD